MVTGDVNGTAVIWAIQQVGPISKVLAHEGPVRSARFSPDGRRIISASADRTARVWDVVRGNLLAAPLRHPDEVLTAELSRDGQRVLTASRDGTAKIWKTPDAHLPMPGWMLDLAETLAGQPPPSDRGIRRPPLEALFELKKAILNSSDHDIYSVWARGFFAASE